MAGRTQSEAGGPPDEPDVGATVGRALKSMGWTLPQSEAAVAAAEQRLAAEPAVLPDVLGDPKAVFETPSRHAPEPALPPPRDSEIDATLARAAREGGTIPQEIEQRMRRDREAAEREFDREVENQ
jgi:hypothetical protein